MVIYPVMDVIKNFNFRKIFQKVNNQYFSLPGNLQPFFDYIKYLETIDNISTIDYLVL